MNREDFEIKIRQFYGSDTLYEYTYLTIIMKLSEGAKFIKEHESWFIDLICSFQPQLKSISFQVWTLENFSNGFKIVCTDEDQDILITQEYTHGNFIIDYITLFVEGNVILLSTEH